MACKSTKGLAGGFTLDGVAATATMGALSFDSEKMVQGGANTTGFFNIGAGGVLLCSVPICKECCRISSDSSFLEIVLGSILDAPYADAFKPLIAKETALSLSTIVAWRSIVACSFRKVLASRCRDVVCPRGVSDITKAAVSSVWRRRMGVAILWYSGAKSGSIFKGDGEPDDDLEGLVGSKCIGDVVSASRRLCLGALDTGRGESGSKEEFGLSSSSAVRFKYVRDMDGEASPSRSTA